MFDWYYFYAVYGPIYIIRYVDVVLNFNQQSLFFLPIKIEVFEEFFFFIGK